MKQDIYQVSNTPIYPIGFKYPIVNPLDLRGFHYGRAGNTLNPDLGAKYVLGQTIAFTTIHANALAGAKLVSIDVAASDGKNGDGIIAADELVGGNIVIYTHAGYTINRMIVGNTATTGAGVMVITLDKPLPCNLTATTMHAECNANVYSNVQASINARSPVVGMPTMPATVGQYLWLQTWGPCWVAPQADVGGADNNIEVVFRHDGSIGPHDYAEAFETKQQHAGFIMANLRNGSQGAPFVFLQITP